MCEKTHSHHSPKNGHKKCKPSFLFWLDIIRLDVYNMNC